ncbi:MAG: lasso peptide biosynthesis PqqD family chaperone [Smithellaceae bacterium]|nr:lasso peptide biosynthesis PqqD family chaperone [Smithellaceae bacterium]
MTLPGNLHTDTLVVRAEGIVATAMDGQWVMMSVENGRYYSLDPVGSRIWDLIKSPLTVNELVATLLTEYEVEEEQCRTNVTIFLNEMIKKGLVAIV